MAVLDTMRTDIMHQAAVTIQRHARGFVVRRQVHRVIRAVIKIQVNQSSLLLHCAPKCFKDNTSRHLALCVVLEPTSTWCL